MAPDDAHYEVQRRGPDGRNGGDPCTSLSEKEEEDKTPGLMEWLRMSSRDGERLPDPKLLAARLVHQYLRRAKFRGSDVRLDLQVVYRPDAVARTTVDPQEVGLEGGSLLQVGSP